MKKLAKILFSLIVVLSFISGCGSTNEKSSDTTQDSQTNAELNTTQDSQEELDTPTVSQIPGLETPPSIPILN